MLADCVHMVDEDDDGDGSRHQAFSCSLFLHVVCRYNSGKLMNKILWRYQLDNGINHHIEVIILYEHVRPALAIRWI